jgi:uncharacterized membrane protein YsdA (DUF1294 family)
MLQIAFYTFLFVINVIAFGLYAIDKQRAHYGLWRIPEAVLLGLAVIGGAYGAGAGMLLFRHKTRHTAFLLTVPLFFIIWMAIVITLCVLSSQPV